MTYCRFCGKRLADGEVCDCEESKKAAEAEAAAKEAVSAAENAVTRADEAAPEAAQQADEALENANAQVNEATGEAKKNVSEFEKNVSEFAGKAKDVAGDLASKAGEAAGVFTSKASEAAGAFKSKVGKVAGEVSKSEKFKKYKPVICGAGALAVVIILLCILFSGGYKKPIDAMVKEINKGKKTDYISLMNAGMPGDLQKLNEVYYGKVKADNTEDRDDDLKDNFEELEDEVSKWKLVFKYEKKEKMSKRELEKYQDNYDPDDFEDMLDDLDDLDDAVEDYAKYLKADEDDVEDYLKALVKYLKTFKKIKVTKGYKVKGYYVLKDGSEEINKTNKVTLYVVKFNGDWVVIGSKDGEGFQFDSKEDGYKETRFLNSFINRFYPDAMMPGIF